MNKSISMTEKVFLKATHWVQSYKQQLPDQPLPSEPVPTGWGTYFCREHFESVKSVVAKFLSESAVSVLESQSAFRGMFNCLHQKQFQLPSKQYKMFRNPDSVDMDARIYGHNEKCKWKTYCCERGGWWRCVHKVASRVKRKPWIFGIYQCLSGTWWRWCRSPQRDCSTVLWFFLN
jgi:hypothetical protein